MEKIGIDFLERNTYLEKNIDDDHVVISKVDYLKMLTLININNESSDIDNLTDIEKDMVGFFDIVSLNDSINKSLIFKETVESQQLKQDKKIFLELIVKEPKYTYYLFRWLYGKTQRDTDFLPFGCKLETIHFNIPGAEELKSKLNKFLSEL